MPPFTGQRDILHEQTLLFHWSSKTQDSRLPFASVSISCIIHVLTDSWLPSFSFNSPSNPAVITPILKRLGSPGLVFIRFGVPHYALYCIPSWLCSLTLSAGLCRCFLPVGTDHSGLCCCGLCNNNPDNHHHSLATLVHLRKTTTQRNTQ